MELRYEQSKQFHAELSGCIFVGIPVFQNFQAAVMKLYGSILHRLIRIVSTEFFNSIIKGFWVQDGVMRNFLSGCPVYSL